MRGCQEQLTISHQEERKEDEEQVPKELGRSRLKPCRVSKFQAPQFHC